MVLFGCGESRSSTPSQTPSVPSQTAQTKTTGCATPGQVTASLAKAGYGSDAAVSVVGDTVSVNPTTANVDEDYARGLAEVLMTDFDGAQTVLVYSAVSGQTYTCTRNEASTVAASSSPAVGEIISCNSYDIAVAGGKFIKQGNSTYIALKIYVLSTGDYVTYIEGDMAVEDEFGESHEMSDGALEKAHLQALDTLSYAMEDGESTGGWVAFKVNPKAKNLTLTVAAGDSLDDSTDEDLRIPLTGFRDVPPNGNVAKTYAKAAKIGGARADAAELTMSEYKQVKRGMSLKSVNAIVGFKGDELSRYGSYSSYSWQNEDGSNMIVSFRNNREYMKAQAGL